MASNNIKVSNADLTRIFDFAKVNYLDLAPKGLSPQEFVARCYLDACHAYLKNNNVLFDLTFDADSKDNDVVREDD